MKTTKSIITVLCLMAITTAWASPINENQALKVAEDFMASHAITAPQLRMAHKAPRMRGGNDADKMAYYVFNASHGGYVIVAGDDRAPAVLAYSDNGTFDPADVPEAMQQLLEGYAAQIEALNHGAKVAAHMPVRAAIAPLIKAQWSQNAPYNLLFPYVNGKHAYVGCVATAMAQLMYYWKSPAKPSKPIPGYTSSTLSIYMPQLPVVNFDWNNMRDTYLTSDTLGMHAIAASQLSLYCAQSVQMDFKKSSSSAYNSDMLMALPEYFGYKSSMLYLQRNSFTTSEWEETVYKELAARRPVLYRGSKSDGGHAFICDGYDGYGMFHINWGWNGSSNGYFLLNVLNPDAQGTGSASGSYGYIENQGIIIGIEPGNEPNAELRIVTRYLKVNSYYGTRSSTSSDFTVEQETHFMNDMPYTIGFDYGWGLYQGDRLVKILLTGYKESLKTLYYTYITRTLSFGSGISSGNYRILPIYSEHNASNWRPCLGSDIHYIDVVINGNSCTVTGHSTGDNPSYTVNSITVNGHMHPNRPVHIDLNVTNAGNSRNDLIYMFANGSLYAKALVDLEKGASGDLDFMYTPSEAGTTYLTFCLDDEGNHIIGNQSLTITAMPTARLSGSCEVQHVTDPANYIVTSDKFGITVKVTNNNSSTYDEDITVKFYKRIYDNYGTLVKTESQPVVITRRNSQTLRFELDDVMNGWQYFAKVYYYSEGNETSLCGTYTHTIFVPEYHSGDVNGDGEVNIADINAIINIILGREASTDMLLRADVDGNGEINIGDVNAIIGIILN